MDRSMANALARYRTTQAHMHCAMLRVVSRLALLMLVPSAAAADGVSQPAPDPSAAMIAVRGELPGLMHLGNRDSVQLLGGSVSLRMVDRIEVDAGLTLARAFSTAVHYFASAGTSLRLATGKRWSLRTPLHLGIRSASAIGYEMFAVTAVSGLDSSWWAGPVGVQLRLVAFAGPQRAANRDGNYVPEFDRITYGMTLSAGVCAGW
jgi:hypothetical protein